MLRIYWADVSALVPEAEGYVLSEYRRKKLENQRLADHRRQGIGAELLLRAALQDAMPEMPWPPVITAGTYGKPEWQIEGLYFSLSHSGKGAACALADRPLGLDVQEPCAYREAVVRRFFAQEEQRLLLSSDDRDADFSRIWTMKESYLKALGTGLSTPLPSFSVFGDPDAAFWTGRLGGLFAAVCVPGAKSITPDAVIQKQLP